MTGQSYFHLSPEAIKYLSLVVGIVAYQKPTIICYENQIPPFSFVLINGEVSLLKRNRIQKRLTSGIIIGAYELYTRKGSRYTIKIGGDSTIIPIENSTLHELIKHSAMKQVIDWNHILKIGNGSILFQ